MSLFPTPNKVTNSPKPAITTNKKLQALDWNDLINGINGFYDQFLDYVNSGGASDYLEVEFTDQSSVEVTHNWGADPFVMVKIDDEVFIPKKIDLSDPTKNSFTVEFDSNRTGVIYATYGSPSVLDPDDFAVKAENVVVVNSVDDLPEAVSNVITLEDNTVYQISGAIDLGADRLVIGSDTTIRGNSPKLDYITSSTASPLITSDNSFRLFEVGFQADSGSFFNLSGTGSEICLMFGVRFFGTGSLGGVSDYSLFEISTGLFVGYSAGLTFSGSNGSLILIDASFVDTTGVNTLDLNGATFDSIKITSCDFTVPNAGVGIIIDADSGNINANGSGLISGTTFNLSGSGESIDGYNPGDDLWSVSAENTNLVASDRIVPNGWEVAVDGLSGTPTQVIGTTPVKLLIDGLGANSNYDYQPRVIRGTGAKMWDTSTNKITPITEGDSMDFRLQVNISGVTGSPSFLTLKLDIGGGATPTNVISTDGKSIKGTSEPVVFSFPIFTLATFLANGGQLFLETDSGTVTISDRSIVLVRTSSGES